MGFLKNIVRNAVGDGISKGIKDAVEKATESIVAPKAEAYANKMADNLDEATRAMDAASASAQSVPARERASAFSSLEASLNRMSQAAENYAATMEQAAAAQEDLAKEWNEKLAGFPMWCFPAKEASIFENGKTEDGNNYYVFETTGNTYEELDTYVAMLKRQGFVQKYPGSDEVLYKDLGGEYLIFGKTDAFGCEPVMSVSMVRTRDKKEIEI